MKQITHKYATVIIDNGVKLFKTTPDNDTADAMMINAIDYPVDTTVIIRTPTCHLCGQDKQTCIDSQCTSIGHSHG